MVPDSKICLDTYWPYIASHHQLGMTDSITICIVIQPNILLSQHNTFGHHRRSRESRDVSLLTPILRFRFPTSHMH